MDQFSFLFSPVATALGYTLLYSVAQAFVIFLCVRIVLKLVPNASSQVKYALLYGAYMGIGAWFFTTLIRQLTLAKSEAVFQTFAQNVTFSPNSFDMVSSASGSFSLSFFNEYIPLIVAFYLLGIVWYSFRLSINFFQTTLLKSKGLMELDIDWQAHMLTLARKMNISRSVQTYFSKRVTTPLMIGFLKPVILLPFAAINHLSPQQFEAILLHELAHIRRNDYVLNIIQSVFDTILFFNPFTWWITKNIREEREKSCDEMVLKMTDRFHYARALLALEEPLRNQPLAMAAVNKRSHLFHRIKNIMEMKNNQINLRQKLVTLVVIAVATISVAWLSPVENKATRPDNKKSVSEKTLGFSTPRFFINFPFNLLKDTTPKGLISPPPPPPAPMPPVAMVNDGILPVPPPPPVPPLPTMPANSNMAPVPPPPPPIPPIPMLQGDSVPPSGNYFNSKEWKQQEEAIRKSTEEMRKYFQSDAWKKQQDLIRENATAMKKYFASPEWKKQQEMMKKNGEEMKKYFESPEWKKQQEMMKKNGEEMKKYFAGPEWKKQQELMKKNAEKVKEYFNSPEWKKQQEELRHATDSLSAFFKSDEWQKQQENIQKSIAKTQDFFKSDAWKSVEENLQNLKSGMQKSRDEAGLKK